MSGGLSPQAAAAAKGLQLVQPKPNELFIDIDCVDDLALFTSRVKIVDEVVGCTWDLRPSPSGEAGHYHATVTLKREVKDEHERILLQACLGSDLMRELLNWKAEAEGLPMACCFFEKPDYVDPAAHLKVLTKMLAAK